MAYKLVVVLTLFCLVQALYSKEHLVQTKCNPYSNSCRTFNDYANDADTYFTLDSSFYFMKGTHHLNVTLFIKNVVNTSFIGHESDIILSNGCSIIWTNSSELFLTSLNVIFNETNKTANNSAISFENSKLVTFSNVSFYKFYCELDFYSRAILIVGSSIAFESCKFENGYHSEGGTLRIEDSNVTFVGHNVFWNNTANYTAGAMYSLRSQIQLSGSGSFMRNRAGTEYVHNGTAIYVEICNISLNGSFEFHSNQVIDNVTCFWCRYSGGAIAASFSSLTLQGEFYFINNSNCDGGAIWLYNSECLIYGHVEFESNKAFNDGGAISARNSSLIINSNEFYMYNISEYTNSEDFSTSFPQSIAFCNNSAGWGGAIHIYDSNMTLMGSIIFMANKAGLYGGGIYYYESDSRKCNPNFIIFQEPSDILFHSNVAELAGGALLISNANSACRQWDIYNNFNCFFTVNGSISFINLNFSENEASEGAVIYGGAIQYCEVEVRNEKQKGYQVLKNLTKTSTKIQNKYASSYAYKICLCNEDESKIIRVQRGQVFNISVIVLGEFDSPINQSVAFTNYYDQEISSEIVGQPYNNRNEKGCRNIGFRILSRRQTEYVILHPPECLDHPASLGVAFHLDSCLPGFKLINNSCKCQENIFKVTGHEDLCNSSTGLIKCPQQDWMKSILDDNQTYQGFIWSTNCPAHLCRNDKDNWLNFSSDNVDFLCLEHRTATLCGACLQSYSLTLGSLECSKCNSNNYLSLLLVFALAGVILVAIFLMFHITVADGAINGLIFYANIINIIKDLVFPQNKVPASIFTIVISWLNLDFGIPTCFYTGLDYYSYTWLQFAFPLYLWFLVGLIILACKYSSRAMKLFGSNPVAVLATVVLMSYSKLLHTSQQILSYVTVYYSNGTQEKRWKIDPNLLYFQGKHLPLAMFGLFVVTVFLLPYIVLISFGYYFQKYSNKRGLRWLLKVKPILDAYYAPFCKNTRYWVGLMLFTRTCLSITYSALSNTERTTILVIVTSVLTAISWIPWLQHKVYQKNYVNVLEGSFILNAIILSAATSHVTQEDTNIQKNVSYTSVLFAFIEFLAILAFHVWHRLNLKKLCIKYYKSTSAGIPSNQCKSEVKKLDKPASTTMVFDIREPLLDDSTTEL